MSRPEQVRFAAHAFDYALGLCIRSLPKEAELEPVIASEEQPTQPCLRAALAWLPLPQSGLVEIVPAAIQDILTEAEHEHRD